MTRLLKVKQGYQSSFGHHFQVLARQINKIMKQRLDEIDIDRHGINQRELSRLLEFPEYHITRSVDALVRHGFVERCSGPSSRRSRLIVLTPQGHEKNKQLSDIVEVVNHKFLVHLDEAEKRTTIKLLRKVTYSSVDESLNTQLSL